jgi:hypothetical protein
LLHSCWCIAFGCLNSNSSLNSIACALFKLFKSFSFQTLGLFPFQTSVASSPAVAQRQPAQAAAQLVHPGPVRCVACFWPSRPNPPPPASRLPSVPLTLMGGAPVSSLTRRRVPSGLKDESDPAAVRPPSLRGLHAKVVPRPF